VCNVTVALIVLLKCLSAALYSPGLDWSGLRWRQVECSCERSNDPSVCMKCREFLNWLRDY
jgi:hypothetical protein